MQLLYFSEVSYTIKMPTVRLYHPVVKQNQDYYSQKCDDGGLAFCKAFSFGGLYE